MYYVMRLEESNIPTNMPFKVAVKDNIFAGDDIIIRNNCTRGEYPIKFWEVLKMFANAPKKTFAGDSDEYDDVVGWI